MVQHGSTRINTDQQSVSTYRLSTPTRISNQFQRTNSQLQLGSAISFNSYQQSITTHQQRSLQHVSNNSNISMRRGVSQASRIDFRGTRSLDVATLEMSVVINQNNTVFFFSVDATGCMSCRIESNASSNGQKLNSVETVERAHMNECSGNFSFSLGVTIV